MPKRCELCGEREATTTVFIHKKNGDVEVIEVCDVCAD